MRHEKLVRDRIIEIIEKNGGKASFHTAVNDEEYKQKLKQKLLEEVQEFLQSESLEEIADIAEVMEALLELFGFSKEELQRVKQKKKEERGGFKKRIILDEA